MHEFYTLSSEIKVNLGKNVVAGVTNTPSRGLGKWLLRNLSYSNRINHCQYLLNCDGNFLTKNLTFTLQKNKHFTMVLANGSQQTILSFSNYKDCFLC